MMSLFSPNLIVDEIDNRSINVFKKKYYSSKNERLHKNPGFQLFDKMPQN